MIGKFEALGRERRGGPIEPKLPGGLQSEYNRPSRQGRNDPEWLDSPDDFNSEMPQASGRSVQEFEQWKAQMKAQDQGKPAAPSNSYAPKPKPKAAAPVSAPQDVDRMFMWDSMSNDRSGSDSQAPSKSSRFSRFFSDEPKPIKSEVPAPAAEAIPAVEDADKMGFQRIMAMLGNAGSEDSQPQPQPQPHQEQPQPTGKSASPQQGKGDDLFFMSLLNKGDGPKDSVLADIRAPSAVSSSVPPSVSTAVSSSSSPPALEQQQFPQHPPWVQGQPAVPFPPGFIPPPHIPLGMNPLVGVPPGFGPGPSDPSIPQGFSRMPPPPHILPPGMQKFPYYGAPPPPNFPPNFDPNARPYS